jgi:hypothetical protein
MLPESKVILLQFLTTSIIANDAQTAHYGKTPPGVAVISSCG